MFNIEFIHNFRDSLFLDFKEIMNHQKLNISWHIALLPYCSVIYIYRLDIVTGHQNCWADVQV